jgi:MFS family permease
MYGKRRMMLTSLGILVAGSVVSALSSSILPLVVGRTLQGLGTAVIPLGMSVAKEVLPPDRTSSGVALVSATLGIGGGLGLPMAGLLLGWYGWRSVFWVSAALAVLGLVAAWKLLPEVPTRQKSPFDLVGAVWLSAVLVAMLLPLSKIAGWGIAKPLPLGMFVGGLVAGVLWYRYEFRSSHPLVDVRLMRTRPLLLANTAGLLLGFGMFSNLYTSIVLMQTSTATPYGFGLSVVRAGLVVLPGALAMMLTSPLSALLTERYGARTSLWVGSAVIAIGFAVRPVLVGSLWAIAVGVVVINCGVGVAYGALPLTIMANVPDSELGSANAAGTLMRASGASLSSATFAALLSSLTIRAGGRTFPSLGAFQWTFVLSAVAAIGAAIVASRLPRSRPSSRPRSSPRSRARPASVVSAASISSPVIPT